MPCAGGTSFSTKRIQRLGIHPWEMTDGPGGVRTDSPDKSTCASRRLTSSPRPAGSTIDLPRRSGHGPGG